MANIENTQTGGNIVNKFKNASEILLPFLLRCDNLNRDKSEQMIK